jgi:hypothetical protein
MQCFLKKILNNIFKTFLANLKIKRQSYIINRLIKANNYKVVNKVVLKR